MGAEKTKLGIEKKSSDFLLEKKQVELDSTATETNQELDEQFENLRKATALKDQIFTKIETIVSDAVEGNPFLKKHIDNKLLLGGIENAFYHLENDADKVIVMENILTIINSSNNYSVEEIYNKISDKIEDKLGIIEGTEIVLMKKILLIVSLILGVIGLLTTSIEGGTVSIAVILGLLLVIGASGIVNSFEKGVTKNEFFDKINDYVPNITKEDFEQLFGNIDKLKLNDYQQGYLQDHILKLLQEYKGNDGVVSQEEITELVELTRNI